MKKYWVEYTIDNKLHRLMHEGSSLSEVTSNVLCDLEDIDIDSLWIYLDDRVQDTKFRWSAE